MLISSTALKSLQRRMLLKYLIESKLIKGDDGNAFLSAVQASNFETLKFLMDNLIKSVSNLVFPSSLTEQNLEIVDYLLKMGADINRMNTDGSTALIKLICKNNSKLVDHLIAAGADVNLQDNRGIIPILKSVENNNIKMVQALVEKKADVNVVDANGYSPLRKSLEMDLMPIFKYLIRQGGNVNEVVGQNGHSLLKIAIGLKNYKASVALRLARATIGECDGEDVAELSRALTDFHKGVLCSSCHENMCLTICSDCSYLNA